MNRLAYSAAAKMKEASRSSAHWEPHRYQTNNFRFHARGKIRQQSASSHQYLKLPVDRGVIRGIFEAPLGTGAASGIWIEGFEAFMGDRKLPNLSAIQCQNMSFYRISSKIDGFKNPSLKIDGFGWTHRTHVDEALVPTWERQKVGKNC